MLGKLTSLDSPVWRIRSFAFALMRSSTLSRGPWTRSNEVTEPFRKHGVKHGAATIAPESSRRRRARQ